MAMQDKTLHSLEKKSIPHLVLLTDIDIEHLLHS